MITGFWYKVNGARQRKKENKPGGDRVYNMTVFSPLLNGL
jgi:hypothetical protein